MKIIRPMAPLFAAAAILSAFPTAQAQSDKPDSSGGLPPGVTRITTLPGAPDPVREEAGQNAFDAIAHGEALLKKGQTEMAIRCYKDAMTYEPDDPLALQRIAEAYALSNRLSAASQTYHHLFYEARWEGVGGNPPVYLGYALVLAKTGQAQEAMKFYQEGARRINYYADGEPHHKVMLPAFGDAEGQIPYSPQALQAMAHVGIAVYSQDEKEKLANLDAAIKLQPNMPQAYYYKGQVLYGTPGRSRAALAAYQQARRFAGIDTQLLIDQVIKENDLEKGAALEQAREKHKASPTK